MIVGSAAWGAWHVVQAPAPPWLTSMSRWHPTHAAAASLFVGKRKLSPALVHRARLLAFEAVRRRDWRAGTSDHPHAPHSAGIATLADEGVDEAIAAWTRIWKR